MPRPNENKFDDLEKSYPDFLYLTYGFEINYGWYDLIEDFVIKASSYKNHVQIDQIKEKFGSLRIYASYNIDSYENDSNDKDQIENSINMVNNLIEEAMFKASITCYLCGTQENVNKKISYVPICESCYEHTRNNKR